MSNHHVGGDVVEDGWRHEVSASVCANGSFERQGGTTFDAGADVAAHLVVLLFGDQRTEQVVGIVRIAGGPVAGFGDDVLEQFVFHVARHDETRVGSAVLAHVPKRGVHGVAGHGFEVACVAEHHAWVLAAALEHGALEVGVGRVAQEHAANFGAAGE